MIKATVLLSCVFLLHAVTLAADQPIQVRVYPMVSLAPADIRISVYVERRAESRVLRVTADSGDFYRSSEQPIEEGGARMAVFSFRQLPPGSYEVAAELIGRNGHTTDTARCPVRIQ